MFGLLAAVVCSERLLWGRAVLWGRTQSGEQCLGAELVGASGQGKRQHPRTLSASFPQTPIEMTPAPVIKAEPKEVNQFLNVPAGKKIEFAGWHKFL